VNAQNKGGGKSSKSAPGQSQEYFDELGQIQAGLIPDYPTTATCPKVSSFFGSSVRYDGSARVNDHFGFHNGIDISAREGTPLLAVADGEVIHAGNGGMLVGNYLWLRHAPQDTGLPVYLFTRYQHLDAASPLTIGSRVKIGDVVGPTGKTGTVGGYFGPGGYSHLHLLVFASDDAAFTIRDAVVIATANRRYLDPLAIYMKSETHFDNRALRDLPEADKHVALPYQTLDGARVPATTKLIWPLSCAKA
jgi:murein DD-endopeptidase MepM/ murein hydrolase activator NlpD